MTPRIFNTAALLALMLFASPSHSQSNPTASHGFVQTATTFAFPVKFAATGDLNGDGKLDIATCDGRTDAQGAGLIRVVLGDGNGTFSDPIITAVNPAADALMIVDLNGDGIPDLVAWGAEELPTQTGYAVLLGRGDGRFDQKAFFPASINATALPVIADFDSDGRLDIAVVNRSTNTVDIMRNLGNGTFDSPHSYSTGPSKIFLAVAQDFDLDGNIDLLVTAGFLERPSDNLTFLQGTGGGRFAPGREIPAQLSSNDSFFGVQVNGISAADLNKDGKPDFALLTSSGALIYLNQGEGHFSPPTYYHRPSSVEPPFEGQMLLTDATADGRLDLLVSYFGNTGALLIFPGRDDGSFDAPAIYPILATSFSADDFNGDGRLDLISGAGGLRLFAGTGGPFLRVHESHDGNFLLDQEDASFRIVVTNEGDAPTTGTTVKVTDRVDDFFALQSFSGDGWSCNLTAFSPSAACSRSDVLDAGQSYPPLSAKLLIRLPDSSQTVLNKVVLSGGGSPATETADSSTVLPYGSNCAFSLWAPRDLSIGMDGGYIPGSVQNSVYCQYRVAASEPWVTVYSGASASIDSNPTGMTRSATIRFTSDSGWSDAIVIHQAGVPGCVYQLWPTSLTIGPSGARYENARVLTASDCPWTATINAPWITIGPGNSGSGTGRYPFLNFDVSPNLSGTNRSGTITVGGQTLTVFQTASDSPMVLGSLPQFAAGGGWSSSIELVNIGSALAQGTLSFFDDSGSPMPQALSTPESPFPSASFTHVLPPHATLTFDNNGLGTVKVQTGSAQIAGDSDVGGFIRFRYAPTGQEAFVPLESRRATSYTLAFDNVDGVMTGIAAVNVQAQPVDVFVIVRDESGNQRSAETLSLSPRQHLAFLVRDRFRDTAGNRGTIEFRTSAAGSISVLGLRITSAGAITTIPALGDINAGTALFAHLASGGEWETSFTLVNTGSATAQARLRFFDDDGNPLPLPLAGVRLPDNTLAASVDLSLPPRSMSLIRSSGPGRTQTGSAQLVSDGAVGAFLTFRAGNGQEAGAPEELRPAGSQSILAFDNTNGAASGVAVSNAELQGVTSSITIRDDTGLQIWADTLQLKGMGHTSFYLADRFPVTANQRGTIEFSSGPSGRVSVIGLRFTSTGAFSTIPQAVK